MADYALDSVELITDLGILFDKKCCFVPHFNTIIKSSNRNLGFVIRNTRSFHSQRTLKTLYYSFVRTKLEYCAQVWSPFYNKHTDAIEAVQKKFVKYMYYKRYNTYPKNEFNYNNCLIEFGVLSLDERRKIHSCLYLYKIINSMIDDSIILSNLNFYVPRSRTKFKLTYSTPKTNYEFQSPIIQMCINFNKLVSVIDDLDPFYNNIIKFKKNLVQHFLQKRLRSDIL